MGCQKQKKPEKQGLFVPPPTVQTDEFIQQDRQILGEIEEKFGVSADVVLEKLADLQKPLEKFHLAFRGYNVVSLPQSSPYKIIKRLYLDKSPMGSPFFLEVRAYENENLDEVKEWTLNLLTSDFEEILGKEYPVFLGRGDRNQEQYDPSHGFSVKDRGIFVAFLEDEGTVYVLYADGPWETFEQHKEELLSVIPDRN